MYLSIITLNFALVIIIIIASHLVYTHAYPFPQIQIREGLKTERRYVFRVSLQANPLRTPAYNYWFIEFNGESTIPFPGYEVWAFRESYAMPRDSAISSKSDPLDNVVTIQVREGYWTTWSRSR
jgi:hypothetical protein